jgi:CheY-like chemotaxis protein
MKDYPAVLYVEDDVHSCKVMRILLTQELHLSNVNIFLDSIDFQARTLALQPKPDVIFLDIHIQPYSGFEMLSILRHLPQFDKTPVIALTASVMNEEVQQLRQIGFDGCIAKPIDPDTFNDALQSILRGEKVWHIIAQ